MGVIRVKHSPTIFWQAYSDKTNQAGKAIYGLRSE